MSWSNEAHVERLKKLWVEGLSASQVATLINREFPDASYSRNAVIGKVNRLGLSFRNQPSKPKRLGSTAPRAPSAPRTIVRPQAKVFGETKVPPARGAQQPEGVFVLMPKNRAAAQPQAPRATADERKFAPLPGVQPVPFGSRGCKWPVGGDRADLMCCGARQADSGPYCPTHNRASHQAVQPGKAATPKGRANELIRNLRRYA